MFIKKVKSGKQVYYSIVEGYRDENGKVKHKTIEKLGTRKILEQTYGNADEYAKTRLKELEIPTETNEVWVRMTRDNAKIRKQLGYVLAKNIYNRLEINKFFTNKMRRRKLPFNLAKVFEELTMSRFVGLDSSIKKAYEKQEIFFENYNFKLDQMYEALDFFAEFSQDFQNYLNRTVNDIVPLDLSESKYDVTNFFWQIDTNDEDIFDLDGNFIRKELRRKGPSKEHSIDPISQVGILCDKNGVPLTYNLFSGGDSEKLTLLEIVDRTQKKKEIGKIIVIADRGINTESNMYGLVGSNGAKQSQKRDDGIKSTRKTNGFIFGQTIRGKGKDLTDWICNEGKYEGEHYINEVVGHTKDGDDIIFSHKSRIIDKTIHVRNEKTGKKVQRHIRLKQMVYFSEKYKLRSEYQRKELLEKSTIRVEDETEYMQPLHRGPGVYVQMEQYCLVNGKKIPANLQERTLRVDKIINDQKLDGFYCLVTSELDMPDIEIWQNYKELNDIEECFRALKSELKLRPMYVRLPEHVDAKVLISFVDLLILRLLKILGDNNFSTKSIMDTIREFTVNYAGNNYYTLPQESEVIDFYNQKLEIGLKKHYMTEPEIKACLR